MFTHVVPSICLTNIAPPAGEAKPGPIPLPNVFIHRHQAQMSYIGQKRQSASLSHGNMFPLEEE